MLADSTVMATVAVSDLAKGREFYGSTLGLRVDEENEGGVAYRCGEGLLFIYEAPSAGHNQATSANWYVNDIDGTVAELKGKGINFERYDLSFAELQGDVYVMPNGMKAAWFKDPDGNILGISSDK